MYKEYASPNFKFWLLTKFMQLHTNLQLQGEKKRTLTNSGGELNLNSSNNRTIHYNTSCLPKKNKCKTTPTSHNQNYIKSLVQLDQQHLLLVSSIYKQ